MDGSKIFKDPVHGDIELPPLCVKIVDTLEFQRLRFIKQLGGACFVYPGATHSRFEHSIGVCHLAGKLLRSIKARQEDLKLADKDILCVELAGLLHDIGHGPFSHLFDRLFIPRLKKETEWKHEVASVALIDRLYKKLKDDFVKEKLLKEDILFIKDLIDPKEYKRDQFLYEVVANKKCEIDVDKWDYFARDSHYLGLKATFDHNRFISFARVCEDEKKEKHICYRDKDIENTYEMFHTRFTLHRKAYQHRVVKCVERMITDAMESTNEAFDASFGRKLSETPDDMNSYSLLTDDILMDILKLKSENQRENSDAQSTVAQTEKAQAREAGIKKAQTLVKRIFERKLYKYVGERTLKTEETVPDTFKDKAEEDGVILNGDEEKVAVKMILMVAKFDFGAKEKDPIDKVFFYEKTNPNKAIEGKTLKEKHPVLQMTIPKTFQEKVVRIFCTSEVDEDIKTAKVIARRWTDSKKKKDNGKPIAEQRQSTSPTSTSTKNARK